MSDSKLTTAEYYAQAREAERAAAGADPLAPPTPAAPPAPAGTLERMTAKFSLIVGAALAVCITILAIGYFAAARDRVNARARHSTSAFDWFLWFGGAKDDQTFEKFLTESAEKSQREWDEMYRQSPAYNAHPGDFDWRKAEFKFEPPLYKAPAGRGR